MLFKHLPRSWKIQDTIREIGWDLIGPEKLNYLGTLIKSVEISQLWTQFIALTNMMNSPNLSL
ncbi:unnamed protein product [Pocillopora meandrina]|uniref:Uncharacterized protein n=1 Tax=Pocillopora meandrina TaxID=46732 RepID=A0AAU9XT75_9CNID|nr:unnamed protein product [Pocillopora meandrina]